MTELAVVTEATLATPLAEYLSGAEPEVASYLGVLTPLRLDAATAETEALLTGVAVHDLGWLRRIAVRGEDRFRWLSGMVSNSVESLADNTGAYNLILNAQGRIQGDCYAWRTGDILEIEIAAGQSDALLAHFDRFIIMDDVELVQAEGQSALGLTGPRAGELLLKLGLTLLSEQLTTTSGSVGEVSVRLVRSFGPVVPHYQVWVATEHLPFLWQTLVAAGAKPVGSAAIESLRIAEGVPAYGIDIQSRDLAQETAQMRALSFTKGCYLGQEIVERIRSRGQVHRHLRAVELTPETVAVLPAIGTEFYLDGHVAGSSAEAKSAGTLTSVTALNLDSTLRIFGIAMIRAEAEVGNRKLTYSGGEARILNSSLHLSHNATAAPNAVEETQ